VTAGLVVFDLDGTLIDSRTDLAGATNALVEELGGARLSEARVVAMVGEGAGVLVRRALEAAGLDPAHPGALDRFLVLYEQRLLDHTREYDGVSEALEAIAVSRRMAVLTNKPARATTRVLEGLGLARWFEAVIGGDTKLGRKPDPAGLREIAAGAGVPLSETVLVGDSPIDLQTARNAGARVCLARYGFGFSFASDAFRGDELFVDSPSELPALLAR
jgi:phosphoglycolate phosphatase